MTAPDTATQGSITLIGGGPGDIDLLTLRAVERLRAADVILYDDLAGDEILSFANPDAELIAVGKRAGHPSPKQQEVSRLMIGYARLGKRVVRVKSGDPSIFSRADEEITAARDAGVAIEIVPGITTATAAAAWLGTSLTKRGVARRVQMITGHDFDGKLPEDIDIAALADRRATTCVFMGKATFAGLVDKLIAHGLSGRYAGGGGREPGHARHHGHGGHVERSCRPPRRCQTSRSVHDPLWRGTRGVGS